MHGGPGKFVYVILLIILLVDLYTFRGLRGFAASLSSLYKVILAVIYWLVPVVIVVMTFYIMKKMPEVHDGKLYYRVFYTYMGILILFFVPKLVFSAFQLGNDISNLVVWIINKSSGEPKVQNLSVFNYAGAFVSLFIFAFTFYGILHGKYHYKVNQVKIESAKIPEQFNGFKIVHISDWHIGSFYGKPERIQEAVDKINSLNPDLILFTGDLVNNIADEVVEFIPQLKELNAKYGIYSVLGNHDYGDYVRWKSKDESVANLQKLKDLQDDIGFIMLNNNSVPIYKDGASIGLAGVENWGEPPFPQHGDLKTATQGIEAQPFKILMSHDPSHWDAEVLNTDIDLTLSGHTHGMQFGINTEKIKWSPVKMKYPRWGGLYTSNTQQLFVSVGIGFIGFPGRVGMRPEIALITLVRN